MVERGRWARFGWMMSGALIAIVAYEAGKARAGVPATDPLVYSGYLTDDSGAPIEDTALSMELDFQGADGTSICKESPSSKVPVEGGRFSLVISPICTEKIRQEGDVWVAATVDGTPMEGRSKIAAVPYALEAGNAQVAKGLAPEVLDKIKMDLKSPQEAYPDCPPGYARPMSPDDPTKAVETDFVVCQWENDFVVKVGEGAASFWIDRYEATGWSQPGGKGDQYFEWDGDYPPGYPRSASVSGSSNYADIYAASVHGNPSPAAWVTWFMAAAACRASGKRLPTSEEWLSAARDTLKPSSGDDSDGNCNTIGGGPRTTGYPVNAHLQGKSACLSRWGTEDMIGNQWEWTSEWLAGTTVDTTEATPWPPGDGYDNDLDVVRNVSGAAQSGAPGYVVGLPAAVTRGGSWGMGQKAGVFAMALDASPAGHFSTIGFRCVIPR